MNTNPVIDVQSKHVTIRMFTDAPLDEEMLNTILEAGRRAPTSSNMQAYSVIVVKDPQVKKQLAVLAGNQKHVETCPVFLAFCADLHRLDETCAMHEVEMSNNLETFLISTVDASLVGMSVQTAAESFGLGAVMIGALRNSPKKVADLLGLPRSVYVVFGMCLGWPDKTNIPPQKPRLPKEVVIHHEQYNNDNIASSIEQYDQDLASHYESLGKNLSRSAWSGPLSKNLARPLRPEGIVLLREMGFNINQFSDT
jgi:nitroreductase